jgi:hypothetical protein
MSTPQANVEVGEPEGDSLRIAVRDISRNYGLTDSGRSFRVASLEFEVAGTRVQVNAFIPVEPMVIYPSESFGCDWALVGDRVEMVIPDLRAQSGFTKNGRVKVCYLIGRVRGVTLQMSATRDAPPGLKAKRRTRRSPSANA